MKNNRYILTALLILSACLFVGCHTPTTKEGYRRAEAGETKFTAQLPKGTEVAAVKAAIVSTLAARGWSIEKSTDQQIVATNSVKFSCRVVITYDSGKIVLDDQTTDLKNRPMVLLVADQKLLDEIQANLSAHK
jgi:hypothetical protein